MINPYYLKYFVDCVESRSFSASAIQNSVSRPAISKAIRLLETQIGAELFEHKKGVFFLTEEGERFLAECKKVLRDFTKLTEFSQGSVSTISGTVRVGFSSSVADLMLVNTMAAFASLYPTVKLKLVLGTTQQLVNDVLDQKIDIAVAVTSMAHKGIKQETLRKGRFACIGPKKRIHFETVFLTEPRPETIAFKKAIPKHGGALKIMQIASWSLIAKLCERGLGIGLVPDYFLELNSFEIAPVSGFPRPLKYEIAAFYGHQSGHSKRWEQIIEKCLLPAAISADR